MSKARMNANTGVEVNELLRDVEGYLNGAMQAFAMVPSVLGRIDATTDDELNALHDRNNVLTDVSKNLRDARDHIRVMREQLGEMVETYERETYGSEVKS